MGFTKPLDDMLSEALITLTERTGITSVGEDSISRLLVELPLAEIADAQETLDMRDKQFRITTADSFGLDWLGDLLGVERKTNTVGRTSESGMKFYIDQPAPVGGYSIPSGTTVWDPENAIDIYYTTQTVTIPEGGTYALTGIISPFAGSSSSGIGTLTMHSGTSAIKCVNLESVSGTSEEEDAQYQYRLMGARLGRNGLLSDAIRTKLLAHPAVLDCIILPRKRGNGTIDAIVYTAESIPRAETLEDIENYMLTIVSDGISVKIYAPSPVIVDITVKIAVVQRNASSLSVDQIRQIAQTNIINYLNTLDLGETLYPDDIDRIVLSVSDNIVDMTITDLTVDGEMVPVDIVTAGEMQRILAGRITVL